MNFQNAIQETTALIKDLERIPERVRKEDVLKFFDSTDGARGFFVALLSGDSDIAIHPPDVLLDALKQAPAAALQTLTKNVVMSAGTELVHKRNGDSENAAGSARVLARAKRIAELAKSPGLNSQIAGMQQTIDGKSNSYSDFLARLNYDQEQLAAARRALAEIAL